MIRWKDTTSYSRSEPDAERVPRVWSYDGTKLRISVHRWHGVPDAWFVSCPEVSIDRWPLKAKDAEKAKEEGLNAVVRQLKDMLASIKEARG